MEYVEKYTITFDTLSYLLYRLWRIHAASMYCLVFAVHTDTHTLKHIHTNTHTDTPDSDDDGKEATAYTCGATHQNEAGKIEEKS